MMIVEAFNYKVWADDRTLNAIEDISPLDFSDAHKFVLQQLNHMVIVEDLFRSRLLNDPAPHPSTNTKLVPDFNELKKRLATSGVWYQNFISTLRLEDCKEMVLFMFADGKNGSMSIEEILFHIVNHGSYHRGSIAHALDSAGVPHPPDGYGIYIHEQMPERRIKK